MSDTILLGEMPMEKVYDSIPQDILDACDKLSTWMNDNGYRDWQLKGCADRKLVASLQRQLGESEGYLRTIESVVDFEKLQEVLNRHAEDHRYDNWSIEDTICKDCVDKDTCKYAGDPYCTDECLADK